MTKKEQAEMDKLRSDLVRALALRWSGHVEPERIAPPRDGYINGWDFNVYDNRIMLAWSENAAHGIGCHRTGERYRNGPDAGISASQNGRALFKSKRDALIALRIAAENKYARELAKIDAAIAEEPEANA